MWAGLRVWGGASGVGRGSGFATEQGSWRVGGKCITTLRAERVGWGRGPIEGFWENPGGGLRVSEVREGSGGTWTLRREVWEREESPDVPWGKGVAESGRENSGAEPWQLTRTAEDYLGLLGGRTWGSVSPILRLLSFKAFPTWLGIPAFPFPSSLLTQHLQLSSGMESNFFFPNVVLNGL